MAALEAMVVRRFGEPPLAWDGIAVVRAAALRLVKEGAATRQGQVLTGTAPASSGAATTKARARKAPPPPPSRVQTKATKKVSRPAPVAKRARTKVASKKVPAKKLAKKNARPPAERRAPDLAFGATPAEVLVSLTTPKGARTPSHRDVLAFLASAPTTTAPSKPSASEILRDREHAATEALGRARAGLDPFAEIARALRPFSPDPPPWDAPCPSVGEVFDQIAHRAVRYEALCAHWPGVRGCWISEIREALCAAGLIRTRREDRRWCLTSAGEQLAAELATEGAQDGEQENQARADEGAAAQDRGAVALRSERDGEIPAVDGGGGCAQEGRGPGCLQPAPDADLPRPDAGGRGARAGADEPHAVSLDGVIARICATTTVEELEMKLTPNVIARVWGAYLGAPRSREDVAQELDLAPVVVDEATALLFCRGGLTMHRAPGSAETFGLGFRRPAVPAVAIEPEPAVAEPAVTAEPRFAPGEGHEILCGCGAIGLCEDEPLAIAALEAAGCPKCSASWVRVGSPPSPEITITTELASVDAPATVAAVAGDGGAEPVSASPVASATEDAPEGHPLNDPDDLAELDEALRRLPPISRDASKGPLVPPIQTEDPVLTDEPQSPASGLRRTFPPAPGASEEAEADLVIGEEENGLGAEALSLSSASSAGQFREESSFGALPLGSGDPAFLSAPASVVLRAHLGATRRAEGRHFTGIHDEKQDPFPTVATVLDLEDTALDADPDAFAALLAGLRPEARAELADLDRLSRMYERAATSDNTLRAYRQRFRFFAAWCSTELDLPPVPAHPEVVRRYAILLAERGCAGARKQKPLSLSTIVQTLAAISKVHGLLGYDPPDSARLRLALRGLRKRLAPLAKQALAIPLETMRQILAACSGDRPIEVRDRALLLTAYFGGLRRSEAAGLVVERARRSIDGYLLHLGVTKGDVFGRRDPPTPVPLQPDAALCPVLALDTWLAARARLMACDRGPLFTGLHEVREGRISVGKGLAPSDVDRILKLRASAAGITATLSAHGLRAGIYTEAARAGASIQDIQRHARHADLRTTAGYVRRGEAFGSTNPTLGITHAIKRTS